MSLSIHTNLASLGVRRNLHAVGARLQRSTARLASGTRIAGAADDASGLGISERMRARVRSWQVAGRNAQDGQSMLRTAEGGLAEISNLLARMRELAVQSASETLGGDERTILNGEFQKLKNEIDAVAKLEFNGHKVLNNTTVISFQVGTEARDVISVGNVDARTVTLGVASAGVGTVANATKALGSLDLAVVEVAEHRGTRGATINRLSSAHANALAAGEALAAAESRIRDLDVALETALLARDGIVQRAAVSILAQANTQAQRALDLL